MKPITVRDQGYLVGQLSASRIQAPPQPNERKGCRVLDENMMLFDVRRSAATAPRAREKFHIDNKLPARLHLPARDTRSLKRPHLAGLHYLSALLSPKLCAEIRRRLRYESPTSRDRFWNYFSKLNLLNIIDKDPSRSSGPFFREMATYERTEGVRGAFHLLSRSVEDADAILNLAGNIFSNMKGPITLRSALLVYLSGLPSSEFSSFELLASLFGDFEAPEGFKRQILTFLISKNVDMGVFQPTRNEKNKSIIDNVLRGLLNGADSATARITACKEAKRRLSQRYAVLESFTFETTPIETRVGIFLTLLSYDDKRAEISVKLATRLRSLAVVRPNNFEKFFRNLNELDPSTLLKVCEACVAPRLRFSKSASEGALFENSIAGLFYKDPLDAVIDWSRHGICDPKQVDVRLRFLQAVYTTMDEELYDYKDALEVCEDYPYDEIREKRFVALVEQYGCLYKSLLSPSLLLLPSEDWESIAAIIAKITPQFRDEAVCYAYAAECIEAAEGDAGLAADIMVALTPFYIECDSHHMSEFTICRAYVHVPKSNRAQVITLLSEINDLEDWDDFGAWEDLVDAILEVAPKEVLDRLKVWRHAARDLSPTDMAWVMATGLPMAAALLPATLERLEALRINFAQKDLAEVMLTLLNTPNAQAKHFAALMAKVDEEAVRVHSAELNQQVRDGIAFLSSRASNKLNVKTTIDAVERFIRAGMAAPLNKKNPSLFHKRRGQASQGEHALRALTGPLLEGDRSRSIATNDAFGIGDGKTAKTGDVLAFIWHAIDTWKPPSTYDVTERKREQYDARYSIVDALAFCIESDGHRVCSAGLFARLLEKIGYLYPEVQIGEKKLSPPALLNLRAEKFHESLQGHCPTSHQIQEFYDGLVHEGQVLYQDDAVKKDRLAREAKQFLDIMYS